MKHLRHTLSCLRSSSYTPSEIKEEIAQTAPLILAFEALGPNARRVLLALAERLVKGKEHGDFDRPHDWDKESAEEALDLAVYQAAKLLGLGKPRPEPTAFQKAYAEIVDNPPQDYFDQEMQREERLAAKAARRAAANVDADGRTPDGKPWVPPVGARVRVVARRFEDAAPYTGEVIDITRVYQGFDDWIVLTIPGDSRRRMARVVPA